MKFKCRYGLKESMPRGQIGELLFATDTNELFVGTGLSNEPINITGIHSYIQTDQPASQNNGDIWLDTTDQSNPKMYIFHGYKWIPTSQDQQFGNLSELFTNNKTSFVDQINEIYGKLFGDVLNFEQQVTNNGNTIELKWTNPVNTEFTERILFYSDTLNLSSMTYEECQNSQNLLSDGMGTGKGNNDSFILNDLVLNTNYNFKIFSKFTINGVDFYSDGIFISKIQKDVTPPDSVTDLTLIPIGGETPSATLQWTNPTNSDFDKLYLVRKQGWYPLSIDDPTQDFSIELTTSTTSYVDNNVENYKTYFYQLFPVDSTGNINVDSDTNGKITTIYPNLLQDIMNFTSESKQQGTQVQLNWTNQSQGTDQTWNGVRLYYSDKIDIVTMTLDECDNSNEVFMINNTSSGEGQDDQYLFDAYGNSYQTGDTVYFKIFTLYEILGSIHNSSGVTTHVTLFDDIPPEVPVISNTTVYEKYVKFNYTDDQTANDWQGTLIFKVSGVNQPEVQYNALTKTYEQKNGSQLIHTSITKNEFETNLFVDYDVTVGNSYTYKLISFDQFGNFNISNGQNILTQQIVPDPKQVTNIAQDTSHENEINLYWNTPNTAQYQEWEKTVIVRKENSAQISPTDPDQDILVETTDRSMDSYQDVTQIPDHEYFYTFYTYGEGAYNLEAAKTINQIPHQFPPQPVNNITQYYSTDFVGFKWSDPFDNDWVLDKITKSFVQIPTISSKGVVDPTAMVLATITGTKSQYKYKMYIDMTMNDTGTYQSYGIFPQDTHSNYNTDSSQTFSLNYEYQPDITSYTLNSINNGLDLEITYTSPSDPQDKNLKTLICFYSKYDISTKTFGECYTDDSINRTEFVQYPNKTDKVHIVPNVLQVGTKYYTKIFQVYQLTTDTRLHNVSQGLVNSVVSTDTTPPTDLISFNIETGDKELHITWTDPLDEDWSGTKILRRSDMYPTGPDDPEQYIVIDSRIKNAYQTGKGVLIDQNVENDITYYYKQFPYDRYGNVNTETGHNEISKQQYVNGIPEIPTQITQLGVIAPNDLTINIPEDTTFAGIVDVLKLDASNSGNDVVKNIQQFDQTEEQIDYDPDYYELDNGVIKPRTLHEVEGELVGTTIEGNNVYKFDFGEIPYIDKILQISGGPIEE